MGTITYWNGIAILQLIVFPIILIAAIFIWKRTGWRVGSKIWRYAVTLSLIRIAGSISSLLSISNDSHNIEVAVAVCQLIGLAPLLLTFIGLLRQIDVDERMPPKPMKLVTLVTFIGLILGIAGVSSSDKGGGYQPGTLAKAAMGIFLAIFVIFILLGVWLFYELSFSLRRFQKKLFIAIALSSPFLLVRLVYSALSDYTTYKAFSLDGNATVYLCMSVLEEIIAMAITMALGISAVLEKDFMKLTPVAQEDPERRPMGVSS
ncbi:uncharacterized protein ASPGLDRAFT_125042 [Aspergillus glaucus CBS 516.65]|uniref:DUF7702 domain-containing protein n=1 Tax=Aspergillus glaucus CBS 516.65 TaxID=1160497 RepID=A0A1L9VLH8_ASPGL|nr:hypothetical protein ASPGLDRAFT_125042 [Aspergillus glaucus CBS 516.65]OJJ84751.1 hypothetical protein ASPGLDRAFT_125042 [Aspergillus glaucus CBS 516.65]